MAESLQSMKKVPDSLLEERLLTVKPLSEQENETYEVMKDQYTGEHYLHYTYGHLSFGTETNQMERFHYFLPLQEDDVISISIGEEDYTYPQNWQRAFLRNGPEGYYIWFDPSEVNQNMDASEQLGRDIRDKLLSFKQKGELNEASVKQFMEQLDRLHEDE